MKGVLFANKTTGAIAPSGKKLAETITAMANLKGAKAIVEYGPGTGVFTEVIEQAKDPDAYFMAMEVNEEFVLKTRELCPRVHVVCDSAQSANKYLREAGYDHCDVIISGLPWTRFPEELQDEILQATWDVLRPGGRFVTFAYATSPWVPSGRRFFKKKLPKRFPRLKVSKPIWQNLPPCLVFIGEKT
jgi:phospholipid N-methyltransferase